MYASPNERWVVWIDCGGVGIGEYGIGGDGGAVVPIIYVRIVRTSTTTPVAEVVAFCLVGHGIPSREFIVWELGVAAQWILLYLIFILILIPHHKYTSNGSIGQVRRWMIFEL